VPKFVATDVKTTINGVDFSDHLAAVTLDITTDEVETTAFGPGWRSRIAGLKDASITLDFHQDFATTGSGAVDLTVYNNFGTFATVVVTPTSGTVSATSPSYTGVYLVSQHVPFSSSVGDLATQSLTWPLADSVGIARGTSA
jgi:predicted secreted protein